MENYLGGQKQIQKKNGYFSSLNRFKSKNWGRERMEREERL